jgi:hypothetical protein
VFVQVEIRSPNLALTCCAAIEAGSGSGGPSGGVRVGVEDFAGVGVNKDRGAVDEDRGAVVSSELDLPHRGGALLDVNLQRRQVALASGLLDGGVDGVFKRDLG